MNWFYYNERGEKIGPISVAVLRELLKADVIKRDTIIENADGRSSRADNVKGLEFSEQTNPFSNSVPKTVQPTQPNNDSSLSDVNEIFEFEARPDWMTGFINEYVGCAFCVFIFYHGHRLYYSIRQDFFPGESDSRFSSLVMGIFLIAIFTAMYVYLTTIMTKLTITNKKTILWYGLLTRNEVELLHSDIRSVVIRQGLFQRMVNVGTVVIATSATSREASINAYRFRNPDTIKKIVQRYQRKGNVIQ